MGKRLAYIRSLAYSYKAMICHCQYINAVQAATYTLALRHCWICVRV